MSLGDGNFKDMSANSIIIDNALEVYGDISGDGYLRVLNANFHNDVNIANDLLVENDVSINNYLIATDASFTDNVTIANDLDIGHDISINSELNTYDVSFHNNVTIANDLHIGNDVSINNYLTAIDGSFQHGVTIANDLYIGNDVSINIHLTCVDASFHNNVTIANDLDVGNDVSINNYLSAMDTSFQNDVTILYNLVVEHDLSINSKLDVYDASFHNNVTTGNDLVVEHDVSINHHFNVYDVSFHNNVTITNDFVVEHDVSINNKLDSNDASFHNDVTIENNLVIEHDVSFNTYLSAMDTSFHNDVTIVNDLVVEHDISVNGRMDAFDVSFHNNLFVDNDISCGGAVKAPQVFAGTGPFDLDVRSRGIEVILAGGGGLDGSDDPEGTNNVNGIATASSTYSSGNYPATKAFNGTIVNNQDAWHNNTSDGFPQWIEFEFPYDVIVTKYKIWPRSGYIQTPKTWTLQGKIFGGSTYQTIDTQLDETSWESTNTNSITNNEHFNEYPVAARTAYRKFRLHMTATTTTTSLSIGELAFYGYRLSPPVFLGSNSNSDAVMRLEGTDGSGCEIAGSGSGDNRFGINIINDAATSKNDALTISKEGNVGINNQSPTVKLDVGGNIVARDISGHGMIPQGGIIMWNENYIPDGWLLCDGTGGNTPDLTNKFVYGGVTLSHIGVVYTKPPINITNIKGHSHVINITTQSGGGHKHTGDSAKNTTGMGDKHTHNNISFDGDSAGAHEHTYYDNNRLGMKSPAVATGADSVKTFLPSDKLGKADRTSEANTDAPGDLTHTHTLTATTSINAGLHKHDNETISTTVETNHNNHTHTAILKLKNNTTANTIPSDPKYIKLMYIMRSYD